MWDVLSGDFDRSIEPQKRLDNITRNSKPGSIVVLHDSLKAERNSGMHCRLYLIFLQVKNGDLKCLVFRVLCPVTVGNLGKAP